MYNSCSYDTGGECQVSANLWLHYSVNVTQPPFFDRLFYSACNEARYGIDLNNGVTHTNWTTVYKYLKNVSKSQ